MKKYLPILVLMLFAAGAWAQSVGEVARQNRMKKKPSASVRLDDDNMPRTLLANAEPEPAKDADKQAADKDKDKDKDKKADSGAAKNDKLTDQIKAQKDEIAKLQRELDIVQREQRLRAAAFYADAGTQLRDQTKFAEDSRKEQAEIDGKKQAIDAAQQKLADLQEQARKAGLGSSD
ncbi:MAG TPA: hypothetical protein VF532_06825 [Candidatus Angelobacter sp.]